jgi:hypothetical protein
MKKNRSDPWNEAQLPGDGSFANGLLSWDERYSPQTGLSKSSFILWLNRVDAVNRPLGVVVWRKVFRIGPVFAPLDDVRHPPR